MGRMKGEKGEGEEEGGGARQDGITHPPGRVWRCRVASHRLQCK